MTVILHVIYPKCTGTGFTKWTSRCPFHKYTASSCGLVSFLRKRESRRRTPWGLDARLRGHDVLLAPDLRNRHLGSPLNIPSMPFESDPGFSRRWPGSDANSLIPPDFVVGGEGLKTMRMVQLIPPYCVETNPAQQGGTENHPWAPSISVYRLQVKHRIESMWTTRHSIGSI